MKSLFVANCDALTSVRVTFLTFLILMVKVLYIVGIMIIVINFFSGGLLAAYNLEVFERFEESIYIFVVGRKKCSYE